MWYKKFINGRLEITNNGNESTVTVNSKMDKESHSVKINEIIVRAEWHEHGVCAITQDGRRILIRCSVYRQHDNDAFMNGFNGRDVLIDGEGDRIRNQMELDRHIDAMYNGVIYYSYNDPYGDVYEWLL